MVSVSLNSYLDNQIFLADLLKCCHNLSARSVKLFSVGFRFCLSLPIFCNHLFFFCNHFEELELIINYAPLTYVYPNTIETCLLTPNHLLFGRQLLYSSNTTSTVVRNLTVFSSTTDKINRISNHFWDRWIYEYV